MSGGIGGTNVDESLVEVPTAHSHGAFACVSLMVVGDGCWRRIENRKTSHGGLGEQPRGEHRRSSFWLFPVYRMYAVHTT